MNHDAGCLWGLYNSHGMLDDGHKKIHDNAHTEKYRQPLTNPLYSPDSTELRSDHSVIVADAHHKFLEAMSDCKETGAAWAFKKEHRRPILTNRSTFERVMHSLLRLGIPREILNEYETVVLVSGSLWKVNFDLPHALVFQSFAHECTPTLKNMRKLRLPSKFINICNDFVIDHEMATAWMQQAH